MAIAPNPDYDLYSLPAEHVALREAVRGLAEDKIAPRAAEIDATGSSRRTSTTRWSRQASTPSTSPRPMAARVPTPSPPRS